MSVALVPPAVPEEWHASLDARLDHPRAVELRDVGVHFDLDARAARGLGRALRDVVVRRPPSGIWALREVSFDVHAGECVAVIGANGAGKSTLLQVVAGLLAPDTGYVRTRGRTSALLNLGVGFDPRLTGRENVFLMGSLLGLSPAETRERLADVISFAELDDFIDVPLRTYSSGMRARLGFAAAAAMVDPHVLVLDEVMGTGDAAFREKSRERVMRLVGDAHAIVLATHDMSWVTEFASYAVLLERGRVAAQGAPGSVATLYRSRAANPARPYGCEACGGQPHHEMCGVCGLIVHE